VRVVEKSIGKRILLGGVAVAEHAGNQPHHGIGDHQRGKNAAREDIVADGNFIVHKVVGDALVDAFVVTAKQDQILFQSEFAGDGIGKWAALRGHQNDF